jgi:hypothetical protein
VTLLIFALVVGLGILAAAPILVRQHDSGDPCPPSDKRRPGRPALQPTQT